MTRMRAWVRPFPLTRAASPRPSPLADGHASVIVSRARRFRTESNNRGKRPSMTYTTHYFCEKIRKSALRLVLADR